MSTQVSRSAGAACVIVITAIVLVAMFEMGLSDEYAANRDFVEYWAAAQQLVHRANPYDPAAIFEIERHAGMHENEPQVSFSPPVGLCLLLPLGFVSVKTGLIVWLLASIGSLLLSIWLIWSTCGRPQSAFHVGGYLFAPAVACLLLGQIGTFLLLGISLFLYLHVRRPYLAGAALLPCVWKPHLFLPFFLVLFLWSLIRKQPRILMGFSAVALASCALTLQFDPHAWSHYSQLMSGKSGLLRGYVPTLSVTLRFLIAPHVVWIQYIPEALACAWASWYFWRRRERWDWMDQGSWVLLVSAACTPYGWFTDEAVLLPAVLSGVYRALEAGRSLIPIALAAGVALFEVTAFGHIASTHYLWTVPAWIAWYVYATWNTSKQAKSNDNGVARSQVAGEVEVGT